MKNQRLWMTQLKTRQASKSMTCEFLYSNVPTPSSLTLSARVVLLPSNFNPTRLKSSTRRKSSALARTMAINLTSQSSSVRSRQTEGNGIPEPSPGSYIPDDVFEWSEDETMEYEFKTETDGEEGSIAKSGGLWHALVEDIRQDSDKVSYYLAR